MFVTGSVALVDMMFVTGPVALVDNDNQNKYLRIEYTHLILSSTLLKY